LADFANANFSVYHGATDWNFGNTWIMVNGLPQLRGWAS
jgi:hypothetical protein